MQFVCRHVKRKNFLVLFWDFNLFASFFFFCYCRFVAVAVIWNKQRQFVGNANFICRHVRELSRSLFYLLVSFFFCFWYSRIFVDIPYTSFNLRQILQTIFRAMEIYLSARKRKETPIFILWLSFFPFKMVTDSYLFCYSRETNYSRTLSSSPELFIALKIEREGYGMLGKLKTNATVAVTMFS